MANQAVNLIEQLQKLAPKLSANEDDRAAHSEALDLSRKLTASLEHPRNAAVDLMYSPFLAIAATVADGMDLFKHMVDSNAAVTAKQLASVANAEELLITRILRPLAAIGVVHEVAEQTWEATPLTKVMATKEMSAGLRMMDAISTAAGIKAPQYFREKGYRCPTDPRAGLLQYAYQTDLPTFALLPTMPEAFAAFNTFMGSVQGGRCLWTDWYPVEERLLAPVAAEEEEKEEDRAAVADAALLVDVGGGAGGHLLGFQAKYRGRCPGRLVLQDTDEVIRTLTDLDSGVDRMVYDFFTEQPVKGARAYIYRHIFHNWSDDDALKMLQQVKKAMKPGYSRLLINDLIVPAQQADKFSGVFDLILMAFSGGVERTGAHWTELLLGKAGFDVVRLWPAPEEGADGIVEAMLEIPE